MARSQHCTVSCSLLCLLCLLNLAQLCSMESNDEIGSFNPTCQPTSIEESKLLSLQTMASMRSFIINPSTPQTVIFSMVETLNRLLQLTRNKLVLHHTLKLLFNLAFQHNYLSTLVFDLIHSNSLHSTQAARILVESLEVLASIAELYPSLGSKMDDIDGLFVSLCFGPYVSVQLWLLNNAWRFQIRPSLLFTVFLGFTKDPCPFVRRASLDGLVGLSMYGVFKDFSLVEGCYRRAVQLLSDMEDCVRSAAVCVVASWGLMLAALNIDMKTHWSNDVFAKLCSMARDMNMNVRVEAFNALGKMELVSEDLLLQSLSKRVEVAKQKESIGQSPSDQFGTLAKSVAGALVHGVEDEFFEVRKSACHSLHTLANLSVEFAHEALNLLMDVLNDDSMFVRLQVLETMLHMAVSGCLKVQEAHLHMFLGVLVDNNREVRYAAREVFKLVKLNNLMFFKLSVDGLQENLKIYPQDEADVFSTFSHIGRNHGKFVDFIIKEVFEEELRIKKIIGRGHESSGMYILECPENVPHSIAWSNVVSTLDSLSIRSSFPAEFEKVEAAFEVKSEFISARVAAFLILSISASLFHANIGSIPPVMYSYTVTLLGRISCAFADVMDKEALLAYLSEKSRSTGYLTTNSYFVEGEQQLPSGKSEASYYVSNEVIGSVELSSQSTDVDYEIQSHVSRLPTDGVVTHAEQLGPMYNEVMQLMNFILVKVPDIWPLIQSGFTAEVLRLLRSWKEELASMMVDFSGCDDALAFTLQYLRIIKLLAELWEHFLPVKRLFSRGPGELNFKLGKLERRVKQLQYTFTGFSLEEELNILELIMVTYTFRLCKVETCSHNLTMKTLTAVVLSAESLLEGGSAKPSDFLIDLRRLLYESGTFIDGTSCSQFLDKCLKLFSLKQFVLHGRLRHLEAKIIIPNNDPENPLPFVPGLPVGIPCEITLWNISSDKKLWLCMSMDDALTQFVFLDLNLFECTEETKNYAFVVPFYRTPKVSNFMLRVCIGLECLFENVGPVQIFGGPKHELTFLCPEKLIYLSNVSDV